MRIDPRLLGQIDMIRGRLSRTAWIEDAIEEKLGESLSTMPEPIARADTVNIPGSYERAVKARNYPADSKRQIYGCVPGEMVEEQFEYSAPVKTFDPDSDKDWRG